MNIKKIQKQQKTPEISKKKHTRPIFFIELVSAFLTHFCIAYKTLEWWATPVKVGDKCGSLIG
jgi:hypothetical protein